MEAQTLSTKLSSAPMTAAMVPGCSSQAFCMALARLATKRRPSSKVSTLLATRAENSPKEWPATMLGWKSSSTEARMTEWRKMAGWVTLVWRRSSSVPSNIKSVILKSNIRLALWNMSFAFEEWS